jgi:prepilin-type N-terminal cleavage/methylation domain-containing protein
MSGDTVNLTGAPSRTSAKTQTTEVTNYMLNKLNKKRAGFTLVEIMIVVAIIALLAAIAVPGFLRARKRSQASKVLNDLRLISAAVDQYAIENSKKSGDTVNVTDWTNYLKKDTQLYSTGKDMLDGEFGQQAVDSMPKVPATTYQALSDVADTAFWSPYEIGTGGGRPVEE